MVTVVPAGRLTEVRVAELSRALIMRLRDKNYFLRFLIESLLPAVGDDRDAGPGPRTPLRLATGISSRATQAVTRALAPRHH